MFSAFILPLLLLAPLPGQLTPEAMEAARQQRIRDYYARWVGVPAPEFGPKVRDRVNGPAVRLAGFGGKKVLLYGFDAGNFVRAADSNVFPENLRILHRVRENIGRDEFRVVGVTAGVMFLFPDVDVPEEIRQLADFPIVPCAAVACRNSPDPYHLLGQPGGIVIDRKGIIQAIYTEQMSEEQIRSAVTASDWSGPVRPAPIDDPWPGREPPKPLMTVTEVWSKPLAGVVGLTCGDWDLDGVDDILALRADDRLSVLAPSGQETLVVSVDTVSRNRVAIRWHGQANGEGLLLQCDGGWPLKVPVHGATGERLWSYPDVDFGGIDSAAWVDIDGDGLSEMLVGFNGYAGLHLV